MNNRRVILVVAAMSAVLALAALGRLCIGSATLGWPSGADADFLLRERAVRLVLAIIVGVALSSSGVALQALLRNPLAEPFILGLSTGAAAGIMAQHWINYAGGTALGPSYLGAACGALASMFIVFLASRRRGLLDPLGLLLTGVVLSTINGAIVLMCNYLADPNGLRIEVANWMMGYLDKDVGRNVIIAIASATFIGLIVLLAMARAMDVATLSASEARSLGVNLARMRTVLFVTSALLAAGAVVLAGPVAFVGLICPHIARSLLGPSHRALLIGAAICGAALMVLADTAAAGCQLWRNLGVMPVGIFTALVGGPVFLWMLHPKLGRGVE